MNEAEVNPALPRSSAQRLLQPIIERIKSVVLRYSPGCEY